MEAQNPDASVVRPNKHRHQPLDQSSSSAALGVSLRRDCAGALASAWYHAISLTEPFSKCWGVQQSQANPQHAAFLARDGDPSGSDDLTSYHDGQALGARSSSFPSQKGSTRIVLRAPLSVTGGFWHHRRASTPIRADAGTAGRPRQLSFLFCN